MVKSTKHFFLRAFLNIPRYYDIIYARVSASSVHSGNNSAKYLVAFVSFSVPILYTGEVGDSKLFKDPYTYRTHKRQECRHQMK